MRANQWKNTMLQGIGVSFTKHKIQKYQHLLGNGHDPEQHLRIAELYKHLGKDALALMSYQAAARSLLQRETPLDTVNSNHLITIYKNILSLAPYDTETANKLSQEYQRRGMQYRAVALHTSLADRLTQRGAYQEAITQYQEVFKIEPGSITARQTCAELYCRIGEPRQGAREYAYIGDLCFDHQKFDGALEYYRKASDLHPEHDEVKQKLLLTQQILEGTMIPQAQANLLKLCHLNDLKQTLAEKEQIERALRHNLRQLKQRYQQSVHRKNRQLRTTQHRLDELSTYVAILKDNLEQIELGKQHLKDQLEQEVAHKQDLEAKLRKLNELQVSAGGARETELQPPQVQRLQSVVTRLHQEKIKLEQQLQAKLDQSSTRESQLRECLADQTSKGAILEHQLTTTTQKRHEIDQQLQHQLRESLQRERGLRAQMRKLFQQHQHALQRVLAEKRAYEEKYKTTQARMHGVEKQTMTTFELLHGELERQCEDETKFSEQLHQSLQEIALLLHNQEQEIEKLAGL